MISCKLRSSRLIRDAQGYLVASKHWAVIKDAFGDLNYAWVKERCRYAVYVRKTRQR